MDILSALTLSSLSAGQLPIFSGQKAASDLERWQVTSSLCQKNLPPKSSETVKLAKDLALYNGLIRGGVRSLLFKILGAKGAQFAPVNKNSKGKLGKELNANISKAFAEWAESDGCDVSGQHFFNRLIWLALRECIIVGEVFVRLVPARFGQSKVPLSLQILSASQLTGSYSVNSVANGQVFDNGILFDEWRRPISYCFRPANEKTNATPVVIPANQVIHLRLLDYYSEDRGTSWLIGSLKKMKDLTEIEDYDLIAAKVQALFAGFITTETPQDFGVGSSLPPNLDDLTDEEKAELEKQQAKERLPIEPGAMQHLLPDEKITFADPSRPDSARLSMAGKYHLKAVAADLGLGYDTLSKDYQGLSYGTQRASMLAEREYHEWLQEWLITKLFKPIYKAWLMAAIDGGIINEKADPAAVNIHLQGWDWIDPQKDATGSQLLIENGLSTITAELARRGQSFAEVAEQRKQELDLLVELGISKAIANHPDYVQAQNQPQGTTSAESDQQSDSSD